MKLTMLGTGNANAVAFFNTCSVISDGNRHFLIDCGGGNRILKHLEDADISLSDIHDIFVTHEHLDHLLGVFWLIRLIGTRINKGKYEGNLRIYCHAELAEKIKTISEMTIQKKVVKNIGDRIEIIPVTDGEERDILDMKVTFFDIESTKAKQFGCAIVFPDGKKLACCGDEPYNECEYKYIKGADWMMHEAFCLYSEAETFEPYEKHHSTVKEASELAEKLGIPNLILYHTEETHLGDRKRLYESEGRNYYNGNLHVPDDMDSFEL